MTGAVVVIVFLILLLYLFNLSVKHDQKEPPQELSDSSQVLRLVLCSSWFCFPKLILMLVTIIVCGQRI